MGSLTANAAVMTNPKYHWHSVYQRILLQYHWRLPHSCLLRLPSQVVQFQVYLCWSGIVLQHAPVRSSSILQTPSEAQGYATTYTGHPPCCNFCLVDPICCRTLRRTSLRTLFSTPLGPRGEFAALSLSACFLTFSLFQWHWKHDCDSFPVEIILHGQPGLLDAALISMYMTRPGSTKGRSYPQRVKMHDFKFYSPARDSHPNLRILGIS